jgi:hypothetical protein
MATNFPIMGTRSTCDLPCCENIGLLFDVAAAETNQRDPHAVKDRINGTKYMVKGRVKIWFKHGKMKEWHCFHNKRPHKCGICRQNRPTRKKFSDCVLLTPSGKRVVDCWSENNKKKPSEVALQCHDKFCFDCDECPHDFKMDLNTIVASRQWCPYCGGKQRCLQVTNYAIK